MRGAADGIAALSAAAPPPLAAWVDGHRGAVQAAVGRAAPEVRAAVGWSVPRAVAWMRDAARSLVDRTVFEAGKMIRDEAGASASTLTGLQNYLSRSDTDDDPAVDLAAAEILRVHSGRQLDRAEWEAAHTAVLQAYRDRYGDAPAPRRIYHLTRSPESGLADGSEYKYAGKNEIRLLTPFRDGFPKAGDLLTAAGFVKNREYLWLNDPRGSRQWWLVVAPAYAEAIADALAQAYPDLAAAVRQAAPTWRARAGVEARGASKPEAVDTAALGDTGSVADVGRDGVFEWVFTGGPWVRVRSPYLGYKLREAGARGWRYSSDRPKTEYWVDADLSRDGLDAITETLLKDKRPRAAQAFNALYHRWVAAPQPTTGDAPRTPSAPDTPEGRWEVTPSGYVRLFLPYRADTDWRRKPGMRAITQLRVREQGERKEWYHYFRTARAWMVADALASEFPGMAAALVRTFGSDKRTFDAEALRCDPLADMSGAPEPAAVRSPIGQAVIGDVVERLRARLPMNPRTGKQLFPFPYQIVGIAFAKLTGYRALFGDAPGLGKTIQALGSIVVDPEELLPAVIVAPASVLLKWRDEIQGNPSTGKVGWLPHVPVHVLKTGTAPLPPAGWRGIILTTWSLLPKHADALAQWGVKLFVGDESHYVKEPTAARSQAAFALAEQVPHVLLLSGTALKNRVMELHNQLSILDPETFGARNDFGEQFTHVVNKSIGRGRTVKEYTGSKNDDELRALLACVSVRRLKSDVLKDLPAKQRVMQPIELTDDQIREYNRVASEFDSWLYEQKRREVLAKIAQRKAADPTYTAPTDAEIDGEVEDAVARTLRNEPLVKVGYLRRAMGEAKVPAAVEFVASLVEQGEPVVVFAEHQRVVRALEAGFAKEGIRYTTIGGGEALSSEERNQRVNDFQAGKYDVFIGTQAAKEGLDLFRASNTVFVERFWSPADEEQAEDRIHRIGQTRGAVIWYLYVPETIDQRMNDAIEAKRQISDRIIGGERIATQGDTDPRPIRDIMVDLLSDGGLIGAKLKKEGARGTQKKSKKNPENVLPQAANVQALVFSARAWTAKTAAHWARMHGYRATSVTSTPTHHTLTQHDARQFAPGSFRTVKYTPTVSAVVGTPRRR
jgi:superfamily II DNA/RNA helicase